MVDGPVMAGATPRPDDAFRFTHGEEVISQTGQRVKLFRPLDFIVLADRAENFGLANVIRQSDSRLLANPTVKNGVTGTRLHIFCVVLPRMIRQVTCPALGG